jgi:dolichol-phosphate mannosyltransferase
MTSFPTRRSDPSPIHGPAPGSPTGRVGDPRVTGRGDLAADPTGVPSPRTGEVTTSDDAQPSGWWAPAPLARGAGLTSQGGERPALSVVVPTRDEAPNVFPLLARLAAAFADEPHEVIFVDDFDDHTPAVVMTAA